MKYGVERSVSGIRWRSNAILKSFSPTEPKRLSLVNLDINQLGLPMVELPLVAEKFVLPLDFLPDRNSQAGLSFAQRGAVTRLKQDTPDNEYLSYLINKRGQAALPEPVVVVSLKDGRWMVFNGEEVVATALNSGLETIVVQVLPVGEALAGIGDVEKVFYPAFRYQKNLSLMNKLGVAEEKMDPDLMKLASVIRSKPMVRMADIYHPLPFPEFQDLTTQADTEATYSRLGMILRVLGDPAGKKVLGLGCNVGFNVFSLAFRGCRVSGLDADSRFIDVARAVAKAKGIDAQFVDADLDPGAFEAGGVLTRLADHPENDPQGKCWDLITCFSMLQWVTKMHDLDYCRRVLGEMSRYTNALLVDIPVNCSGVYLAAPEGKEISWMEEFLRGACEFTEYRYVGKVAPYLVDPRYVFYCGY